MLCVATRKASHIRSGQLSPEKNAPAVAAIRYWNPSSWIALNASCLSANSL